MSGDGTTTIAAAATLNISGAAKWINGRTLTNNGTIDWTESSIQCRDGVVINNQSGAVFEADLVPDGAWLSHWTGTQTAFNNAGTFKATGAGTVYTNVAFTNSGTVDAHNGRILFDNPAYNQTAGVTQLSGETIEFNQTANIQGGQVRGHGTINGSLNNTGGALSPGLSPGILTLTGSYRGVYTQGPGASLNIEIGGLVPGGGFDQLNPDGKGELDGALNLSTVGGYSPDVGDSFKIMTFAWHSGTFATVTGADLGCGKYFGVSYGDSDVTLQVQGPPAPTLDTLSRSSAVAGEAGFTLTVTGSDFNTCSKVRWNGADRTTTFVSSTQLDAAITSGDLAHAGSANVTVFTPNGGASDPQTFSIDKSDTTATIVSHTPDPSVTGQAVTVQFSVAVNPPGGGSPTGTVTVSDGAVSCNATLPATGCQLTFTTAGTKTLTASYGGSGDYNGSTSPGVMQTVNLAVVTVENDDPPVQYNGWKGVLDAHASAGLYRISKTKNDSVTYKFTGTGIQWVTMKGPDQGRAQVLIDGANKGTFDLYSPTLQWQVVPKTFSGLANKAHTFVVKVLGTKNGKSKGANVVVDAFIVGGVARQESDETVQYNAWSCTVSANASGGSYHWSKSKGAIIRFTFVGTQIDWITAKGPAYGKADIYIDGKKKGTYDLYQATLQWQVAISLTGLSAGAHTIEIRILGIKRAASKGTTVIVDAFRGPW